MVKLSIFSTLVYVIYEFGFKTYQLFFKIHIDHCPFFYCRSTLVLMCGVVSEIKPYNGIAFFYREITSRYHLMIKHVQTVDENDLSSLDQDLFCLNCQHTERSTFVTEILIYRNFSESI